ncbi:MAG: hypothetical protein Q4C85_07390 [Actinomyces sp.]|uniref:hypothetical protein n=1 Tax=Actinomyces sp. TaxID=29317 RepID=UPI0026DA9CAA|nr:hypothetical protein [Actinomyces sp.]MDO4243567.1 hypothetical protein [Actinomyces sp.]
MTLAHAILQLASDAERWWAAAWRWLTGLEFSPLEDHWVIQWMYDHPVVSLGLCLGALAAVGILRGRR